jgi:hypothetical protein
LKISMATIAAIGVSLTIASPGFAAPPPPGSVHIRGTIQSISPTSLVVLTSLGSESVSLPSNMGVMGLIPSRRANIKPGSFLGIASVPTSTGGQAAREVVVFPETVRGAGEGSYDWDLPTKSGGKSRMTNGTVGASVRPMTLTGHSKMTNGTVLGNAAGTVTLTFKSGSATGSQAISLPPGIPFVTFVPGSPALLTPGTHVFILANKSPSGAFTAVRILAGKNGLVPPM